MTEVPHFLTVVQVRCDTLLPFPSYEGQTSEDVPAVSSEGHHPLTATDISD